MDTKSTERLHFTLVGETGPMWTLDGSAHPLIPSVGDDVSFEEEGRGVTFRVVGVRHWHFRKDQVDVYYDIEGVVWWSPSTGLPS